MANPQGKFLLQIIGLVNLMGGLRAATRGGWHLRSCVTMMVTLASGPDQFHYWKVDLP